MFTIIITTNNYNDKYISKTLNPSMRDLHEAQTTVHVQSKPSKKRNQWHQEKSGGGGWRSNFQILNKQLIIHYITLPLTQSPLPPSPHPISPPITHSPCLSLSLRDQHYRCQQPTHTHQKRQGGFFERRFGLWEGTAVLDVGRKVVSDKGRLNRALWPVTKALEFPSCTEKIFSSELEWRVHDRVYTERQDDRYGGRVPSKKWKAMVATLKSILSLTGSQ